ncbi:hypothetical protein JD78_03248 [Modestobacter roseus]|uniref:UGSC-like domain-containing protein n=1 Tax=Modestobacter roseus TaxID=1181884 RepID=A0A562IVA4_9ACTN|nr:hypothetical protein [Modestobacter roseus]MQA32847.1 hypothetical protein [Modestobacter roseus]TWH74703.1 hypothetical protein JD78_03248 [Modestobacter roseus]
MELHEILDPTGAGEQGQDTALAPRTRTLRGATLGLLDNGKPNGAALLEEFARQLRERHGVGEVLMFTKPYFGTPVEPTQTQRIFQECDFAITAIGD